MTSKLAELIAEREGFYVKGSLPQRNNNPGDLEAAPGMLYRPGSKVGYFETPEEGWAALERQLGL